jgi:hypothetical protein
LEGGVGPNLTDNVYLHGNQLADIFKVIREGVPAKGMISWKGKLSDEEFLQLASYIILNQKRFLYSFSYKPLKINIISQENLKNHFNHSIKRWKALIRPMPKRRKV